MDVSTSSGVIITNNTMNLCDYGISVTNTEVNITGNTFSSISSDAITVSSPGAVMISGNTISNVAESAVIYGANTTVQRNNISTVCTMSTTECG